MHRILSSVDTFIQCVDFYPVYILYPVGRILSSVENFFPIFSNETTKISDYNLGF